MERADWGELLTGFQEHLRAEKGLAPLTVRNYRTDLEPLRQFMAQQGPADFDSLDRGVLRAYLAWLHELGYVRPSIVRKLSVLRTFLQWLRRRGVLQHDPVPPRGIMKLDSRLPRFLSQEEAGKLVQAPDTSQPLGARDRALLEGIYAAGLRGSDRPRAPTSCRGRSRIGRALCHWSVSLLSASVDSRQRFRGSCCQNGAS